MNANEVRVRRATAQAEARLKQVTKVLSLVRPNGFPPESLCSVESSFICFAAESASTFGLYEGSLCLRAFVAKKFATKLCVLMPEVFVKKHIPGALIVIVSKTLFIWSTEFDNRRKEDFQLQHLSPRSLRLNAMNRREYAKFR